MPAECSQNFETKQFELTFPVVQPVEIKFILGFLYWCVDKDQKDFTPPPTPSPPSLFIIGIGDFVGIFSGHSSSISSCHLFSAYYGLEKS